MTAREIIEGNKLIAEFLEIPKCGRCKDCGAYQYGPAVIFHPEDMTYHSSWDWLMKACKKCSDISINQERPNKNSANRIDLIETEMQISFTDYNPLKTFEKVIEFIKLYNRTK